MEINFEVTDSKKPTIDSNALTHLSWKTQKLLIFLVKSLILRKRQNKFGFVSEYLYELLCKFKNIVKNRIENRKSS